MNYSKLYREFDIIDIEKGIISIYIERNSLLIEKGTFLDLYLDDFVVNPSLLSMLNYEKLDSFQYLEKSLELLIPKLDRKLNGAFFTPAFIVDYIAKELNINSTDKVLDPSCGCGAFLLGAIKKIKSSSKKSISDIVKDNIYGKDILDYNVRRAKALISVYAMHFGENLYEEDFNIICCDALKDDDKRKYDAIIGNPPYIKYQDLEIGYREYLSSEYFSTSTGTFNIYFAFFEKYFKSLSKKIGRLAFITPNNFFTSLSAKPLREYFSCRKNIDKIIDFRDRKVFDAQTYTAITFISTAKNNSLKYARLDEEYSTVVEFLEMISYSKNYWSDLDSKKWRLLIDNERENIRKIETMGYPIGSLYRIAAGIATLKDKVFTIVDNTEESESKISVTFENKNYLIEKEVTRKLYKVSTLKDQSSVAENRLRIIYPYKDIDNSQPVIFDEEEMRERFPGCFKYLLANKKLLDSRDKGKTRNGPFYQYGRSQGIGRYGVQIINPTFSKYPRFLLADTDSFYVNGYGFYPKPIDSFKFDKSIEALLVNPDVVSKILNSTIMHYYIQRTSVKIQGNYPCYQKNFIERFCIPKLSHMDILLLRSMSDYNEINQFLVDRYQVNIPVPNLCA